jgi:hypothetical protein
MTNREKIIVGLMVLAVVYGVYTVFFSAPRKVSISSGHKELETLNSFVTKVAEQTKTGLSKEQTYILQKARTEWKQDPFIQIRPKLTREEEAQRQPLVLNGKILYTGFLEMGNKRLAIINGMEYEVGDVLEKTGLVVRNISPSHVVVAAPDNKNKTLILPMEEIE